ncbi:hypothetical protein [Actinocatenispora rupis]|uniref:Uncharacterized protein n=1 Tax=Actinocatenispora rupis TaxID=519421 RepID=A0A8J3NDE4_9ACTN|nr:hypothetical protein [Actinocatenispora rupis]GID14976.1 hypothetical protein Aru02nite_58650 [Actinocatenispora rupis]
MGWPDGAGEYSMWFRTTLGLRLIDGRARIAHERTSTPFQMNGSARAATDLAP